MTKLYSKVFAISEDDRERDEALSRRMEVSSHTCSATVIQLVWNNNRTGLFYAVHSHL